MNASLGATILMVTHNPNAASYASRILFLKDGQILRELVRDGRDRNTFFLELLSLEASEGELKRFLNMSWRPKLASYLYRRNVLEPAGN